ncbi:MAG TPA: EVE domain-containing protein [Bacteroidia bacterium]|nr:EVE domain-containing protein [Bacteroidia bacterium]
MNYWLVKSEPENYSWEQLVAAGDTRWDGVRSYAARNHLRSMKKEDLVMFYHSGDGKAVVGIAIVSREAYQDPTTNEDAWVAINLKPFKKLKAPVELQRLKADKSLSKIPLIRIPRLSVMPLEKKEFDRILEMSEKSLQA